MCTKLHYIYNKYIHERILVPCGKCEACRQQKADARAFRIKHSTPAGYVQLFVTLTYKNDYLPVVCKFDLKDHSFCSIYRYNQSTGVRTYLNDVYIDELPYMFDCTKTPTPRHFISNQYLGVIFYKDFQDFFKRLRVNLQRHYNYEKKFKYYCCTEYGETYYRPHAHIVFSVPTDFVEIFRTCICESWPYADYDRTYRNIEVARHCADYVASYVNCDSRLPKVLQLRAFRQKHSYSQGYGMDFDSFALPSLLEKANQCSLVYSRANSVGKVGFNSFLVPQYVISRFFPKFKGYSLLPPSEICKFLLRPTGVAEFFNKQSDYGERIEENKYIDADILTLVKRLSNSASRYINTLASYGIQKNYFDYCIDYERVWRAYEASKLKLFYQSQHDDIYNPPATFYDNLIDVDAGLVRCDYLDDLLKNNTKLSDYINYNQLPQRVESTNFNSDRYSRKVKQRKVTNLVMHQLYTDI